jgi:hypothetical protein
MHLSRALAPDAEWDDHRSEVEPAFIYEAAGNKDDIQKMFIHGRIEDE